MGQLDEVSQSIGRIQGTLEAHGAAHSQILREIVDFKTGIVKRFEEYDEHIERLDADLHERKGAQRVWIVVTSFTTACVIKLIEHIPRLF